MLWTVEAVEDLKKLALQGKSASHISAALGVGSRNAVIGKASRIGIKLGGGGAPPCAGRPHPARLGPDGRQCITSGPAPTREAHARRPLAICRFRRGTAPRRRGALRSSKSERCGGCGWRTFVNPLAGGRWAIRGAEISPIAGSRRSEGSRIAPAIAKWLIARRRLGGPLHSERSSAPSGAHGGWREGSRVRPEGRGEL